LSRRLPVLGLLGAIFVLCMLLALGVGTSSLNLLAFLQPDEIVLRLRLPRVILAALTGAGLAASGVTFQALLRNPLADPYIVGVSGGAALGGIVALLFGVTSHIVLPLFAFMGAGGSAFLIFSLARWSGRSDALSLLLMGVIFNAFAGAVVTFVKTIVSATKAQEILFWLMGVIGVESSSTLIGLSIYLCIGAIILLLMSNALNLLVLGEEKAQTLGLDTDKVRLSCFLAASLMVGAVVAFSGMVGFVGLVVPHILRRIFGADHRWLIPASLVGGATFMVVADALARLTFYCFGTEIPVGVITAFTGGPFFLILFCRKDRMFTLS
jgi:iron complex transport system permease protein